jgi:hypothetical protein
MTNNKSLFAISIVIAIAISLVMVLIPVLIYCRQLNITGLLINN